MVGCFSVFKCFLVVLWNFADRFLVALGFEGFLWVAQVFDRKEKTCCLSLERSWTCESNDHEKFFLFGREAW